MTSFDVNSLFTNVPLTECVNLCCDLLCIDSNLVSYSECKFASEYFRKRLNSAVKGNNFILNKQLHKQIDGVAMGSPLGPSLANILLCALERKFLDNYPCEFKLALYRRYVDGTFCIFRNRQQVGKFLSYSNSCHKNVTFMVE